MTPYEQFNYLTFKWMVTMYKCVGINFYNDTFFQKFIRFSLTGLIFIYVSFTAYSVYYFDLDIKLQCISVIGFSFQVNYDLYTKSFLNNYFQ